MPNYILPSRFLAVFPRSVEPGVDREPASELMVTIVNKILEFFMVCEFVLVPLLVFLILRYSKSLSRYKYYLLNNVVWSFAFGVFVFVIKPVFHYPAPCVHSELEYSPKPGVAYDVLAFLFMYCLANAVLSMVWTLIFRFACVYHSRPSEFILHSKYTWLLYLLGHILFGCIMFQMVVVGRIRDPQEAASELVRRVPQFANRTKNLFFVCFYYSDEMIILSYLNIAALIFGFLIAASLLALLYHHLHRNVYAFPKKTIKMQFMLFKALSIQMANYFLLEILPLVCATFAFAISYRYGEPLLLVVLTVMVLHGILDYLLMIYFIAPYRRALIRWLKLVPASDFVQHLTRVGS
ncbi:unnamed protein product [Bursaphelenchus xylophilus]|uniref:(pine wood nematode) hypothetical protein n=1 Tax=Bursaphelenchus xylophilus TaxID=6326 RepID=A0A1I7RX22_BURXY|nr:unnamed protein product [Bursaphelenchus xylophilus]CAG9121276.1 unnamed protein product [Bursaphelenchus xylophilus]